MNLDSTGQDIAGHIPRVVSRRPRRRRAAWVGIVAAAALLGGACSNSDGDSTSSTSSSPSTTVAEPEDTVADDPTTTPVAPSSTDAAPSDTDPAPTTTGATAPPATEPEIDLGTFEAITDVPGVTDDAIQYAVLGTGPSNPAGYCLLECYKGGVQAYFDWRNSLGGVHGRQLEISHVVDDQLGNTQVEMLGLLDEDDVFGLFFAPLLPAGHDEAAAARLPIYTLVQGGPEAAGLDNVFVPAIFCADCITKSTVHQAQLLGGTKVGTLGLGVSQASKDCVAATKKAFDTWGGDLGIEHVYANDGLPFGMPNGVAPEVTAMKDLGVDYVTLCIDQNGALTLEQELNRQGMGDVPVVIPQGYGDSEFAERNADLLEGDVLSLFVRPFDSNVEGTLVPTMLEWIDKGGYELNDQTIQGWINADTAVTGLLAAGAQFDRDAVIDATNAITSYDAGGVLPAIDWTKQHTRYTGETMRSDGPPVTCTALVRVEDGEFVMVGNPDAPFYAYDNSTLDWSEPVESGCRAAQ